MSDRTGRLFCFEGIDGTGKSTQAAALADWLDGLGLVVRRRREPTHGPHGQALRASATTGRLSLEQELELLELDRRAHVQHVIGPALQAGEVVVLDRYYFSTAAYQGARGADPMAIVAHHETFAPRPDLTFLLDLDPVASRSRIAQRGATDAFEGLEDLLRARAIFRSLVAPDVVLVSADATPEALTRQLARLAWAAFDTDVAFPADGLGDAAWQQDAREALARSPGLVVDDSGSHA